MRAASASRSAVALNPRTAVRPHNALDKATFVDPVLQIAEHREPERETILEITGRQCMSFLLEPIDTAAVIAVEIVNRPALDVVGFSDVPGCTP